MKTYLPEGILFADEKNQAVIRDFAALKAAHLNGDVLEAKVTCCDADNNLYVQLGELQGFMPHVECAVGVAEGLVRDIAIKTRVNKPVAFQIVSIEETENGQPRITLSRRKVQEACKADYLQNLVPGDVIPARVTHLDKFGAFCDIGAGVAALLPIDYICVSRIPHPGARFTVGQDIRVLYKSVDERGRITLTHKELLGTWEENANRFAAGDTITGIVRSVEEYGIFVELAPNLAGLAEFVPDVHVGDTVSVFIKSMHPERMKIKLALIESFGAEDPKCHYQYPEISHMDTWKYQPDCCEKQMETVF